MAAPLAAIEDNNFIKIKVVNPYFLTPHTNHVLIFNSFLRADFGSVLSVSRSKLNFITNPVRHMFVGVLSAICVTQLVVETQLAARANLFWILNSYVGSISVRMAVSVPA